MTLATLISLSGAIVNLSMTIGLLLSVQSGFRDLRIRIERLENLHLRENGKSIKIGT